MFRKWNLVFTNIFIYKFIYLILTPLNIINLLSYPLHNLILSTLPYNLPLFHSHKMTPFTRVPSLVIKLLFFVLLSQHQSTIFDWTDNLFLCTHNLIIEICPASVRAPGTHTLICSSMGQYNVTKAALALS